jgi:cell division protein FtsB
MNRALHDLRRPLVGIGIALLAVWIVCCALDTPNGWIEYRQKRVELQRLQQENQRIENENKALERQVTALKTDPHAIETIAREDLGLVRPGDIVYKARLAIRAPSTAPRANAARHSDLFSTAAGPRSQGLPFRVLLALVLAAVVALSLFRLPRSRNPM